MNLPEEYEMMPCGSLRLKNPKEVDYSKPYWGEDAGRSTIEEQCFNVNGYRNGRGETKVFSVLRHCVGAFLLEIGASPGELLRVATAAGFDCEGIEPCQDHVEFVSERSGCKIINAMFPCVDFLEKTFDTIVAMDVIEHVDDPHGFVDRAMDLLTERGRLILMLPAIYDDGLFDEKNFHPEHINIFSQERLRKWLKPIIFDRWVVGHEIVVVEKK